MSGADVPEPDGWVPEFPGQRPPFAPGNRVALGNAGPLVHGAYSPRRVDPLAAELVQLMLEDNALGYLQAPAYRPELWSWARAEAMVQLLTEYLDRRGEGGIGDLGDERVRSAYALLHRAEARAASGRAALGLSPLSRARLGRDRAATSVDMARLMAELAKRDQGEGGKALELGD